MLPDIGTIQAWLIFWTSFIAFITALSVSTPKGIKYTVRVYNWLSRHFWHRQIYMELAEHEEQIKQLTAKIAALKEELNNTS